MPSCCDTNSDTPLSPPNPCQELTVALAGNPNSGKTTIFNGLTGLRQKVANYPGVTVEKKTGRTKLPDGTWANIIDLPGTYSLVSRSPDEYVAMEVLRGLRSDTSPPDVVIVVVDASNLQRNLYLVSQLIELGRPLLVALNMIDVAKRRHLYVDAGRLAAQLGVPVVPLVGHRKMGVEDLKAAIRTAKIAPMPPWPLPDAMQEELVLVGGGLAILDSNTTDASTDPSTPIPKPYQRWAERLLIGDHAGELAALSAQEPVSSLLRDANHRLTALGIDPMQADIEAHYRWIESVARAASSFDPPDSPPLTPVNLTRGPDKPILEYQPKPLHLSEKLDAVFIHKFWGLLIFTAIMATLFISIFWLAKPIMDYLQNGTDWLGNRLTHKMSDGPLKDLITDGIFKGVGTVIVFVPQIALLFLFLAILEDSGYLARAAFLMDRLLAKVGLHGKSFIPLLSSFACAIPGIMATRTIENRRDRLATIFIAPFMSCSARLPVYSLLIGAFFSAEAMHWSTAKAAVVQAGIMLACYLLGILAAVVTAWIFKRSFLKGAPTAFILELPSYKLPQLSQIARQVWVNSKAFVTKAGTTIFCLSIILWAMSYYPRLPQSRIDAAETAGRAAADEDYRQRLVASGDGELPIDEKKLVENAVNSAQSEYSISGRIGHFLEPAFKPLGFDWKMDVGLIAAFAAREVFVSTMGIVYSVGEVKEDETKNLAAAMQADHYPSGKPVWTPLVAISLLVWFVLAMQCMSTVAIVRRETAGWRWPIFMIVYMNVLAYLGSLAVFQLGRAIFSV